MVEQGSERRGAACLRPDSNATWKRRAEASSAPTPDIPVRDGRGRRDKPLTCGILPAHPRQAPRDHTVRPAMTDEPSNMNEFEQALRGSLGAHDTQVGEVIQGTIAAIHGDVAPGRHQRQVGGGARAQRARRARHRRPGRGGGDLGRGRGAGVASPGPRAAAQGAAGRSGGVRKPGRGQGRGSPQGWIRHHHCRRARVLPDLPDRRHPQRRARPSPRSDLRLQGSRVRRGGAQAGGVAAALLRAEKAHAARRPGRRSRPVRCSRDGCAR